MKRNCLKGFSLIELLIVAAIISILAAIAVPNLLEAQTRSRVSRVLADQRSLATAIEAYTVDFNHPPIALMYTNGPSALSPLNRNNRLRALTTPVSYMTSLPIDPFLVGNVQTRSSSGPVINDPTFEYLDRFSAVINQQIPALNTLGYFSNDFAMNNYYGNGSTIIWALHSPGPDHVFALGEAAPVTPSSARILGLAATYDPTNGTTSYGDIIRTNASVNRPDL